MIDLNNQDCLEAMRQMADNHFDLAIVDPPYGLGDAVVNSGGRFKRYENKNGNWDKDIPSQEYFDELFRISKNQIIWGGNYFPLPPSKCFIVWDKKQPQGVSFAMAELAWASFEKVAKIFRYRTQGQEGRFHPTQKPLELCEKLIKASMNKEGETLVVIPFAGSGSECVAAKNLNVNFIGYEINEEYVKLCNERLKNN